VLWQPTKEKVRKLYLAFVARPTIRGHRQRTSKKKFSDKPPNVDHHSLHLSRNKLISSHKRSITTRHSPERPDKLPSWSNFALQ